MVLPDKEVRESYFKNKLSPDDLKEIKLEKWVEKTDGLSLAHLRELVVSVVAMGNSFDDTLNRLNGLKVKPRVKSRNKKVGY